MEDVALIKKILRLNEYVLLFVILVNLLFLFRVGTRYEFNLVDSYLVDFLSKWSQWSDFPVLAHNSLETTLLISAIMFFVNLPVCFYLVGIFLKNRHDEIFAELKSSHRILLEIGFQSIYPDIFYEPVLLGKGFLRKLSCLVMYLLFLFMALEWYVWLDVFVFPGWLAHAISHSSFCLFLWNICLFILISFVCSSFASFLLIIIASFRREL